MKARVVKSESVVSDFRAYKRILNARNVAKFHKIL